MISREAGNGLGDGVTGEGSTIQLQAVLDGCPAPMYIKDRQGRYLLINRSSQRELARYNLTLEQCLGKTDYDLFPKELADEWYEEDRSVLETGQPLEKERIVTEGEQQFTYFVLKFPLFGTDGKPYAVCGLSNDVTLRKKGEEAFRESERRAALLYEATAALSEALTFDQVGEVVLKQGQQALAARNGAVTVFNEATRQFRMIATIGYPAQFKENWQTISLEDNLPIAEAGRTGQVIIIESKEAWEKRYPKLKVSPDVVANQAFVVIPLKLENRLLGTLSLSFAESRHLAEEDTSFMQTLARQCAQALERARLYEVQQQAREAAEKAASRIARLQALTAALSKVLTSEEAAKVIIDQALVALAAKAGTVSAIVIDENKADRPTEMELLYGAGYPPGYLKPWQRTPLNLNLPLHKAIETNQPIFIETLEEAVAEYPLLNHSRSNLNSRAWACLPLSIEGRLLGGIGLSFDHSRIFTKEDREFMVALAEQCAQALERARLYEAERQAQQQAAFLGQAGDILAASLDYKETLAQLTRLLVPFLADSCTIDLVGEDGSLERVALAAADPTKEGLLKEALKLFPPDPSSIGARQVLSSNQSLLIPELSDEIYQASAADETHLEIMRQIGNHSVIVVPMLARGRVLGTIALGVAESGRRFSRKELTLAEELARRIANAVDNARLYREAREAVRIRDEFLSIAAHELKTPITSLKGHSQLITRQLTKTNQLEPTRVLRAMSVIDQQADKLSYLVAQLLEVSRLEAGKIRLERKPTDISQLVETIVLNAQTTLTTSRHELSLVHSSPPPILAWVDPLRLEQVINNLLTNAIKYSPEGGLVKVELGVRPGGLTFFLKVTDQGIGIPPENRARLFERFYQAHPGNYTGGMGLGLYISSQIVQLHGGNIRAEFPPEGGTCFIIELPLAQNEA